MIGGHSMDFSEEQFLRQPTFLTVLAGKLAKIDRETAESGSALQNLRIWKLPPCPLRPQHAEIDFKIEEDERYE
jgi:hypothetical protein